ncbi:COG4223 family protein [Hoeflea sp. TYP-13]|uniref:COG4223 family protein n=1 Tax=Hoeflea sp. TYP-13 TaxID=3230023 RepID=UPI0034C6D2CF
MAQGSKPRHSRSTRKPVTIDLEPEAVSEDKKPAKDDKKPATGAKSAAAKSTPAVGAKAKAEQAKADKSKADEDKKAAASAAEKVKAEAARAAKAMESTTAAKGDNKAKADGPGKKSEPVASKPGGASKPATDTGHSQKSDTQKAEPQKSHSGGGVRAVTAGLAGGVVAIAIFAGLQWGGVLPAPGASGSQSGGISAELEALKQSVASLESGAADGTASVSKALEDRISAIEKAAGSAANSADGSSLAALKEQVSALEAKVGAVAGSGQDNALSAVTEKLTALEKAQADRQADFSKLQSSVTDLTNRIGTDEAKQDQSLQALDARLASIEKSLEGPREDIKVARALAAASLKAAIDRGGAFMAELEAFASVDGDSPAIEQLNTLAASGVPSRATLLNEFPSVATDMINAATGSTPDTGWVDRLMNSATSLVQVRPVGEVSGDSVQAIVARMETKLNNGDLQGAVNEWKTLPEASRKVSGDYEKDLEARILVEKLVSGTVNAALPKEAATTNSTATTQTGGEN